MAVSHLILPAVLRRIYGEESDKPVWVSRNVVRYVGIVDPNT